MDEKSDQEIVSLIAQGHINEYRYIIKRYKKMAYTTAYSIIRNREDTEDAVQEAFIRSFRSLHTFRGDSKFSTWLFRIVYFTALTKYQQVKSGRSVTALDESTGIQYANSNEGINLLNTTDRIKYLNAAMKILSREDGLAITLYYLEEKSQKEISELTGWNLSATKVRIHRARIKIDHYLQKILAEEKRSLL
jgi:RNA polymerase sigma factor (sigma-70 family)